MFNVVRSNIFLAGLQGSGKDFIAAYLVRNWGYTRIAFADALKEEVAYEYGVTVEEIAANKAKWRSILQSWGCSRRDAHDVDYWLKQVARKIEALDGAPAVITDTRFPNEFKFARENGFLIRVEVPERLRRRRLLERDGLGALDESKLNHPSEMYVRDADVDYIWPGNVPVDVYEELFLSLGYGDAAFRRDAA